MLNLVQLQERLKDIPMQALMQYANGSNPQVPPFLALGELNRRKKMQEGAAADQAKEMEGAPSVKDQIEQATGLLALQGSRQRQASQQQQGIQANMPMAAPNTTTSEPAQMAEGGAVNDIVVPRDYQSGGQVNPDMLRKLAMLKAMKQRQGVSSIPVGNMFKRSDYAGGGIVAFAGDQGSYVKYDPSKDEFEEDKPAGSMGEFLLNLLPSLPKRATEKKYKDPVTGEILSYDEYMARARNVAKQAIPSVKTQPTQEQSAAVEPTARPAAAPQNQGIASVAQPRQETPTAISRALGLKPEDVYPIQEPRGFKDIMTSEREKEGLMGISDQFLKDRESRLAAIQKQREEERAQQPMDRLMEFLGGVAEARGGNWATQGAAGAKRAMALEKEQRALRDKQDMEMDQLKYLAAEKRDALLRGDKARYDAIEKDEIALKRSMREGQANMAINQAKIETDREQAKAQMVKAQADVQRGVADKQMADRTRQMSEISDYISNFRSRYANAPKYITNPALLEQDAMAAAMKFFGPERFRTLGLGQGAPEGKTMTMADVQATARASGKTPQQVIEAAKAKGYTIQ